VAQAGLTLTSQPEADRRVTRWSVGVVENVIVHIAATGPDCRTPKARLNVRVTAFEERDFKLNARPCSPDKSPENLH
jgi:hypothetical protein